MSRPLLSIVVPSFNSAKYLAECLESLKREKCEQVEYLFIDGASADATMEIIEPYRDMFSVIISEKDRGQSHAFNKGFALAKGDYFTWLNSDDVFCPGALRKVIDYIKTSRKPWYAANMLYIDSESRILRCCKSCSFERFALKYGLLNVFGPSTIFRRDLYLKAGNLREDLHYCMDTEYWWRLASFNVEYVRIPIYLWALRLHAEAKTASAVLDSIETSPETMKFERERLQKIYYPKVSKNIRKVGILYVKARRILNLSYIFAFFDTKRAVGKHINHFDKIIN